MANSDWQTVEVSKLPAEIQEFYADAKGVYKEYKLAKGIFESEMQALFADKMPEGCELKFGYNFGKLSVAVGPKVERKAKSAAQTQSLGDWLAGQASAGQRG